MGVPWKERRQGPRILVVVRPDPGGLHTVHNARLDCPLLLEQGLERVGA